jgi:hypothetical protein
MRGGDQSRDAAAVSVVRVRGVPGEIAEHDRGDGENAAGYDDRDDKPKHKRHVVSF